MLSIGATLNNRYRVDRLLEIGALEGQYGAWDLQASRPVLIKELTPQPELDSETLAQLQADFEREASRLTTLDHPHIVPVLDHFCAPAGGPGSEDDLPNAYLILEATAGQTLSDRIARQGALKEETVIPWAIQLLAALAYAHDQGVCHRDIKPENIIIQPDNNALLTNFELLALWNPNDPRTWTAKRVMGTPEYAPPERWGMRNTQIDPRSDVYSLGATLYHALTGEQPLTAGERTSNPYHFLQVKALSPRVSAHTQAVVLKAMSLPRDKRYQTAEELAADLAMKTGNADAGSKVQPPAIFLPKARREFSWMRALGLVASAFVLFVAGLIGLRLGSAFQRPTSSEGVASAAQTPSPGALATPIGGGVTAAEILVDATPDPSARQTPDPEASAPTDTPPTPQPSPTPVLASLAPAPPPDWDLLIDDQFMDNANAWLVSDYEDDWGTTVRQITDGRYEWTITADQPVGRWCTPELGGDAGTVTDFFVTVDAQRAAGPDAAAYGLILRHVDGSYYLFSVRDDGYYQFSLWYGFDWQTVIDWTETLLVNPGGVNKLAVLAQNGAFEFYINDEFVDSAEDDQLPAGEVGLSISTAATEGEARFVFDDFQLWRP